MQVHPLAGVSRDSKGSIDFIIPSRSRVLHGVKTYFIEKIRKPKLKNTSLIDELKLNVHLFKITRKLHVFAF